MKNVVAFSLVLYGDEYINKFFKYSFKTILKNINNLNRKFNIKFIISTDHHSVKKIKNTILSKINTDIEFILLKKQNTKYEYVTREQLHHLKLAKDKNIKYLFFLYADIIFSKYSFKNSIKKLTQNRKLKVISTFALLLKEKDRNFKKFFYYLLKKEEDHLKLLINNKNIIDEYHQSFERNILNYNKSFFYLIKNKNLYIKTFHYHPIIVKPDKINLKDITNLKIHTLDNQFMDKFFSIEEVYVEQDLKKISIFSFDSKSRVYKNIKPQELSTEFFRVLDYILLSISSYEKSKLENKLFMNNTISYINDINNPVSIKNVFFDKKKFLNFHFFYKNKKYLYNEQEFVRLLTILNNLYIGGKKNYIFIFFLVIFFLIVGIISANTISKKIYFKLKDILKFFFRNKKILSQNNYNVIYSLIFCRALIAYFKNKFKII